MTSFDEKQNNTIDEAIASLLARADNSRNMSIDDVRPRVISAIGKYLNQEKCQPSDIRSFVNDIHSDDLLLILACERGDEAAWEELVAKYDHTVKSAARKISANNEDAEDLASSIWAELFGLRTGDDGRKKSKLIYFSGRGSLAGWLRAVVSQLAIDQFRKHSRFVQIEEAREFENLANDAAETSDVHIFSHSENPEEIFSENRTGDDVASALRSAIEGLAAEDKLILKMYYFEDLKLKEIASTFGFHEATASRRLARIQTDIRKAVERILRERHGWSGGEIKRYLSETAARLGLNVEKLFTVMLIIALVQDLYASGVL